MLRREDHIDWWCRLLHKRVKYDKGLIIPDIRFQNEVDYFKKNSDLFILLQIDASLKTREIRGWSSNIADKTATELEHLQFEDSVTEIISNDSSVAQLYKNLDTTISKLNLVNESNCMVN